MPPETRARIPLTHIPVPCISGQHGTEMIGPSALICSSIGAMSSTVSGGVRPMATNWA